jgi:hypothetical protein
MRRWEDNINMGLKEFERKNVDRIQDRKQRLLLAYMVTNFHVNFLIS